MSDAGQPPDNPSEDARPRSRFVTPESMVALLAIIVSAVVSLATLHQSSGQTNAQIFSAERASAIEYDRQIVKEDRAELRDVLDESVVGLSNTSNEVAQLGARWLKNPGSVRLRDVDAEIDDATDIAARLAIRLDERSALPVAVRRLNRRMAAGRRIIASGRHGQAEKTRLARAMIGIPEDTLTIWNEAHELGKLRLK